MGNPACNRECSAFPNISLVASMQWVTGFYKQQSVIEKASGRLKRRCKGVLCAETKLYIKISTKNISQSTKHPL